MLLPQQIQAILYHFMMGWMYGCTFSFLCSLIVSLRFSFIKGIMEILYHIAFTLLMFYGLYRINGGVTNAYLIVIFLLGVFIYYKWYFIVLSQVFTWFKHLFDPIRNGIKRTKAKWKSRIRAVYKKRQRKKQEREKKRREKEKAKEEDEQE